MKVLTLLEAVTDALRTEIEAFLTDLAANRNVAPSTQNQAL